MYRAQFCLIVWSCHKFLLEVGWDVSFVDVSFCKKVPETVKFYTIKSFCKVNEDYEDGVVELY